MAGDAALLNAALESMPYGFSVWDDEYRLILWNQRYLDIYNMPAERVRWCMSLEEICEVTVAAGNHPGKTAAEVYQTYDAWLREQTEATAHIVHRKSIGGRVINSTYMRSPGLGWVSPETSRPRPGSFAISRIASSNCGFRTCVSKPPSTTWRTAFACSMPTSD
jgi:hypothetical protein